MPLEFKSYLYFHEMGYELTLLSLHGILYVQQKLCFIREPYHLNRNITLMRLQLQPHYPDVTRHIPSDYTRWLSKYRGIVIKGNGIDSSVFASNRRLLQTFHFLNP